MAATLFLPIRKLRMGSAALMYTVRGVFCGADNRPTRIWAVNGLARGAGDLRGALEAMFEFDLQIICRMLRCDG